ncbi:carbohydrate ABC transporter membrane protein 1 (CUT1 family) [Alicyclobacillus sacchari]|uniref:Carbohydrate ABC transporter membrane protein 1 (CUT1 family) n=2 Tax=Alicyclobacillus sacchari TaxID=392010 RepID=A0A4R8LU28_9BACL|nr:sugar ABC transporter permease [Alicyclobacillus sacchari]TDY51250.1 carbohydrate ABC transporter membrane protein 1 (CUT1 family) [Alicyclobacillus sacchari]GMA56533.1 sugar ABC transporter permease [Alicyclobacillus sacchari]
MEKTPVLASQSATIAKPSVAYHKKKKFSWDKMWSFLTLVPSLAAVLIFVYGFLGWTGYVSFTKWNSILPDYQLWGFKNYQILFQDYRFQSDLRNLLFFTVFFILACMVVGLFLAILVDQKIKGENIFRNIFLFPMALSFIVTGVVWQWLLNPKTGVNLIFEALGASHPPAWYTSTRIVPSFHVGQIQFGLPIAMIAVLIASVWQMSGFAMALYLSGLRAVPEEIKEAAHVDGANGWKTFWRIIFPQLRPVTVTVVIILVQSSMKTFDLVYAMTGPGNGYVTDLPSLDMFTTTFQANQYAQGSAIAIVMFVLMMIFVIPYLWNSLRKEGQ